MRNASEPRPVEGVADSQLPSFLALLSGSLLVISSIQLSVLQQIFIDHLLCARSYARHWRTTV